MNDVAKYLYHKLSSKQSKWYPFIAVYYLTYACDFNCSYCSDGKGEPYYKLHSPVVPAESVLSTVKAIRRNTSVMTLTGGEPLLHPDFGKIITEIEKMQFKNLLLTSNGYYFENYIDEIAKSVDTLIFSLDSLNPQKSDQLYGMPNGTFDIIMENILKADKLTHKKYRILISSVVTPDNISDLYEVYRFAKAHDFGFAASPQLVGVDPQEKLWDNQEYKEFFDFLILEKKSNKNIYGTKKYLSYMGNLTNFDCAPFTMLVVSPEGEVYYPCLEIGNLVGNIKDFNNIHEMKQLGLEKFGAPPICANQCHSACALTFSLLLGKG